MVFILLIQPQSNSLYPDGAIYLDRFFLGGGFRQAGMKTIRNEMGNEAIFKM